MFKFHCPHCQQKLSAEATQSGATLQCPACGVDFVIPSPTDEVVIQPQTSEESVVATSSSEMQPEQSSQPEHSPEPGASHSFAERLRDGNKAAQEGAKFVKKGAMVGWAGLKRRSKQAALKAQIEKLRNIDLRKALHSLGKKAFEQGVVTDGVAEQFQAIRDLDARIAEMRDKAAADAGETKMAALKRVSKDTAKASQAQALTVKREHLIAELGREIHARKARMSAQELSDESAAIAHIECRISGMEDEIRELGDEGKSLSSTTDFAPAFSMSRLIPLFVCCLLFGWVTGGFLMPNRFLISSSIIGQIIPVAMIGVPAIILAIYGILFFLRPARFPRKESITVLFFTMLVGLAGLLIFQSIANYAIHTDSLPKYIRGLHGKSAVAGGFIMAVVFGIGKAYQYAFDPSSNVFQQFFGFIFGVGFCEEAIKLLPLFYFALARKDGLSKIDFRGFLIVAFFSGLGFGIGEAIYGYAPWSGNPNPGVDSNVLRWFACVPSHAIYTVIDACFLWLLFPKIIAAKNNYLRLAICALTVLTVAVVHGSYNVLSSLPYVGFFMDAASIFLMYFMVVWVAKKTGEPELIQAPYDANQTELVGWLKNSQSGKMRFGRIYAACSIMIVGSLVFSVSLGQIQSDEGGFNNESAQAEESISHTQYYQIFYGLATQFNPGLRRYDLERFVNIYLQEHPEVDRSLYGLLVTAAEDGYLGRPRRY